MDINDFDFGGGGGGGRPTSMTLSSPMDMMSPGADNVSFGAPAPDYAQPLLGAPGMGMGPPAMGMGGGMGGPYGGMPAPAYRPSDFSRTHPLWKVCWTLSALFAMALMFAALGIMIATIVKEYDIQDDIRNLRVKIPVG